MLNIDALIKEISQKYNITKTKNTIKISAEGKNTGNQHDLSNMLNASKTITIKPNSITLRLITNPPPKQEDSLEFLLEKVAKKVFKISLENGITTEDCLKKIKDNL